jgi:hypothetical protein
VQRFFGKGVAAVLVKYLPVSGNDCVSAGWLHGLGGTGNSFALISSQHRSLMPFLHARLESEKWKYKKGNYEYKEYNILIDYFLIANVWDIWEQNGFFQ